MRYRKRFNNGTQVANQAVGKKVSAAVPNRPERGLGNTKPQTPDDENWLTETRRKLVLTMAEENEDLTPITVRLAGVYECFQCP